ncbi:MAG: Gfo/Idh/MocA family protein [Nitrososphaeria archaeon]
MGKIHLETLQKLGVEVSAFARTEGAIEECSRYARLKRSFTDINEAIDSSADIIDIVLPHSMHKEIAIKALKRRKHVLVEKPIGTIVQNAWEMVNTARKVKRKFMLTEQFFFSPSVRVAEELIKKGKIGKVHTIIVRSQTMWEGGGWRVNRKEMGGGNLIDGGIHFMDTFLNFGGEYEEVKVFTYRTAEILEGEDSTMAMFKFRIGAYGMFYYSWGYPNPPLLPRFEVIGDHGSIVEDARLRSKKPYGPLVVNEEPRHVEDVDVYYGMLKGFMTSVEEDSEVPFAPELAVRDLDGVMAMYSASNTLK